MESAAVISDAAAVNLAPNLPETLPLGCGIAHRLKQAKPKREVCVKEMASGALQSLAAYPC